MFTSKIKSTLLAGLVSVGVFAPAHAGTVATYTTPTVNPTFNMMSNPACIAEGDFVSCSTAFLNYEYGIGAPNYNTTTPNGFGIDSPQGMLNTSYIVVGTGSGGATASNGSQIDTAYDTKNKGNFLSMTTADPTNGPTGSDSAVAWDMKLTDLTAALTFNGIRKDLLIGLDMNENGNTPSQGVQIWAMVTLRDTDNNLKPKLPSTVSFELNGRRLAAGNYDPAGAVYDFETAYSFDGINPTTVNPLDMTYIAGDVCVKADGSFYTLISANLSSCLAGDTHLATNLGTSKGEWVSYIPELNEGLEGFIADGYDTMSVQLMIGCFNNAFAGCNGGGYEDMFIMAGNVRQRVPEPATLALAGLGLLGLGWSRRRKLAD